MWDYTKKVMDHFLNPRNVGEIENPDAVGEVGNLRCGDALKIYLKLDENQEKIIDARFQTFGCASAIASASALTELVMGKTVDQAAELSNDDIAGYLGSLPEEKMHCSVMGMEALQAAISNLRGQGRGTATVGDDRLGEYDPEGLDRTVCYCFSVTERKIREVIAANHLENVEQVIHFTKAGGGCGGCKPDIDKILVEMKGQRRRNQELQSVAGEDKPRPLTNLQRISLIQKTIAEQIAPGLQADGGDLELIDIDGNRVIVKLKGACAACPSAHITLKRWVEAKLRELVDRDIVVEEELEG